MYREIVVADDGSPQAGDALALGQLLAAATGASLTAASVVEAGAHWHSPDHRQELEQAADPAGAEVRVVVSTSAARGLHELAEEIDADLVILGSARHGKAGQILAGSVATKLLHGAPCSVAIAPRGFADNAPERIDAVSVGYDGSPEAQVALTEALELGRAAGVPVKLVGVAEPAPIAHGKAGATPPGRVSDEAVHEQVREQLDEALATAPETAELEATLVDGEPARALAQVAVEDGGVLVVGSRGYGPLRRVLLGSVSTELVRTAPCPVIVHPRPAKAPKRGDARPPRAAGSRRADRADAAARR